MTKKERKCACSAPLNDAGMCPYGCEKFRQPARRAARKGARPRAPRPSEVRAE